MLTPTWQRVIGSEASVVFDASRQQIRGGGITPEQDRATHSSLMNIRNLIFLAFLREVRTGMEEAGLKGLFLGGNYTGGVTGGSWRLGYAVHR